jgi:hypothetical protein
MPKKNVMFSLTVEAQGPSAVADASSAAFISAVAETLADVSTLTGVLSDDIEVTSTEAVTNSTANLETDLYTSEVRLESVNSSLCALLGQNLSASFNSLYDGTSLTYLAIVRVDGVTVESKSTSETPEEKIKQFFETSAGIGVICGASVLLLLLGYAVIRYRRARKGKALKGLPKRVEVLQPVDQDDEAKARDPSAPLPVSTRAMEYQVVDLAEVAISPIERGQLTFRSPRRTES